MFDIMCHRNLLIRKEQEMCTKVGGVFIYHTFFIPVMKNLFVK